MKNNEHKIQKVLFVGLGGIGQRHLRNLKSIKGEEIQVFAYRKRNAQFVLNNRLEIIEDEELNSKYAITCVSSLEEAFEKGVRTVFICNPTSLHMEVLLPALEAGCSVFIEKPIAASLEQFDKVEKLLQKNNNVVFVGYQNRYHPCIKKAKELIECHAVGDVLAVYAEIGECVKNWHKYENYRDMYACRKDLGGGVIVTQIHELDYLYYLFGLPQTVYAVGGKLSDLDIDVEDVVDILMGYETERGSVPVSVHQDYIQVPPRRSCRIIGTKGKLEFDLLTSEIVQYDELGTSVYKEQFEFERNDMFLEEMKQFLACAETGEDSPISFKEGKQSLVMAMAAKESMQSGQKVVIKNEVRG